MNEDERPLNRFTKSMVDFIRRPDGPTAVEYAVMLALIVVVCITAIATLGTPVPEQKEVPQQ